jgi:phage/conjugal plasmid C-4 type zinc finger TraR family protein
MRRKQQRKKDAGAELNSARTRPPRGPEGHAVGSVLGLGPTTRSEECVMAVGWARDGAVQEQIDATVESEIARVRSRRLTTESLIHCEDCGEEIPRARREAVPGVRRCIQCQSEDDKQQGPLSTYNRRGSKDSQLK